MMSYIIITLSEALTFAGQPPLDPKVNACYGGYTDCTSLRARILYLVLRPQGKLGLLVCS